MMLFAVKEEMNNWMVALASHIYLLTTIFTHLLPVLFPPFLWSFAISLTLFLNAPAIQIKLIFLSLYQRKISLQSFKNYP